jgi:hypothetical protein
MLITLVFAMLMQAAPLQSPPPQTVVVGLDDGMKVTFDAPDFSGFIDGHSMDAVLLYREKRFHGEMPLKTISRIDFGRYKKGKPFQLKVTLHSGDELNVETERRDFVTIRGKTDLGTVTIKHPDPISAPVKLSTGKPNRKKSLTIQYLEFPAQ